MLTTLKTITFSMLFIVVCFHSINWINTCESYFAPGKPHPKGIEKRCELIWEHLAYQYKLELPKLP